MQTRTPPATVCKHRDKLNYRPASRNDRRTGSTASVDFSSNQSWYTQQTDTTERHS